jgi:hypothetical protein
MACEYLRAARQRCTQLATRHTGLNFTSPIEVLLSPRFVHVGHHVTPPAFGKTLCGKLTGLNTPLSDLPPQAAGRLVEVGGCAARD